MSIDPTRYALITHEYRWKEEYDSTIDSRYSKARELEMPTHLKLSLISTLITTLFNMVKAVRRRYIVELDGTDHFHIDDFAAGPPQRYLTAPEVGANALPCIVSRVTIDEDANKTVVELWG